MSDTIEVRYVGPLTEGVVLAPVVGAHAGQEFVCPHNEWVALPVDLVDGTDHTYDRDYKVPANPDEVDSDYIVEHGHAPLTEQFYLDADENVKLCWEVRTAKSKKAEAAPSTEGLNDGDG